MPNMNDAPRRPAGSSYAGRPAGSKSASSRPAGSRPSGNRPSGNRPSGNRRPAPRRRKKKTAPRFYIFAALAAVIVVVLIILLTSGKKPATPAPLPTPTPAPNAGGPANVTVGVNEPAASAADLSGFEGADIGDETVRDVSEAADSDALSAMLAGGDNQVRGLTEDQLVRTDDLNINESLPDTYINILLLGTDERNPKESARSDTMIICSVNRETGKIKLTSIMRDTAIDIQGMKQYNGTYGINCANYFGGPRYAMHCVNKYFGMNIKYYASIDFFGFQRIAQRLGGIEVDLSEAEMKELNKKQIDQARIAYNNGIDEGEANINELLENYGPNIHLNGRQTVAYARIRHTDNDYRRAERQRTVIKKLAEKARSLGLAQVLGLATEFMTYVKTNIDLQTVMELGTLILNSPELDIDSSMRLPVNGSYKEERRKNNALLFDTDWDLNARELYNYIYY